MLNHESWDIFLTSDIYSFDVVLFEVLCGGLCVKYTQGHLECLVPMWMESYENNKLDKIIFKDLTPRMDPTASKIFSDIAYQCLHNSHKQRPSITFLMKKLEVALRFQERHDASMTNVAGITNKIRCGDELSVPLSKGEGALFLNTRKMVISYFDDTLGFKAVDLYRAKAEKTAQNMYCSDYKAILENDYEVAVKILRQKVTKSHREFEAELNLVSKIRHPNLLAPRAYILDPNGDKILVFDCMPKGSLAAFLHAHQRPKTHIDWAIRMQIAKGVARGLHSLHTHHNIIHGNLTSHSVLLDKNINSKISDFWLSRLMNSASHSHMISTAWSLGYQAPGVTKIKKGDTKADVYSLGIIMLELLTGKSPEEIKDLPQRVLVLIARKEWTSKVFDHELMKDASAVGNDELLKSLNLALQCVHPSPQGRPDVRLVLQLLEEIIPETATTLHLR